MSRQYLVSYELAGPADAAETGVSSAFELQFDRVGEVPTVATLKEGFPYVGSYHFRAKIRTPEEQYAWLDLTDETAPLPVWAEDESSSHIHVRVLPLSFEGSGGEHEDLDYEWDERDLEDDRPMARPTYAQQDEDRMMEDDGVGGKASWSKQLKEVTETVLQSDVARDLTKKGITVGKQVGKQVGKLWNSIKAAATDTHASSSGGSPALPSPAAMEYLSSLERLLGTTLSDPNCLRPLEALWSGLFPGQPFERSSARWKLAGFQSEDPLPDFRGTGLLCLQCMIHFSRHQQGKMQQILREQSGRSAKNYPYAVVANNITCMIVEAVKLRERRYAVSPTVFWGLFEDGNTVFEELFTHSLFFIDRVWVERNATRDQFPKLIQQARQQLEAVLACGPTSLPDFQNQAARHGFSVV